MTELTVPFDGKDVTVRVDNFRVSTDNKRLRKGIAALTNLVAVKPIVNVDPWLARLIVQTFGGKIVNEPEFDDKAGDILVPRKNK